jgi:chemotaxis protein methyltransferase CheR
MSGRPSSCSRRCPSSPLTDAEFEKFRRFIFDAAGITLAASKKALVQGRLGKRLGKHGLESFGAYFRLLSSGAHPDEVQMAVDLLTTNETYFFREPKHFDFLREQALAARQRGPEPFGSGARPVPAAKRPTASPWCWPTACGGVPWDVLGTDISTRVLQRAARACTRWSAHAHIPPAYLRRYCLQGHRRAPGGCWSSATCASGCVSARSTSTSTLPPTWGSSTWSSCAT